MIVYGYSVAHKFTGVRCYTSRAVYDTKGAATAALNKLKKAYEKHYKPHGYTDPNEFEVIGLIRGPSYG